MTSLIFILALLVGCDSASLDNGLLEHDGFEARPVMLPITIVHDDTINDDMVNEAIGWWAERVDGELFVADHDPAAWTGIDRLPPEHRVGYVMVWQGYPRDHDLEDEREPLGESVIIWGEEASIVSAEVIISPDATDWRRWYVATIVHELGHCLGLADDPDSVELNSIMSETLEPSNDLTDGDRALLMGFVGSPRPDD